MINLVEDVKHVIGLAPQVDAVLTSDKISLKNAHKAWIQVLMQQTTADQCTITPLQATNVGGAGKALSADVPIWADLDVAASDALAAATAAKAYQLDAGVKNKVVWFEIDPAAALDLANGYDCIYVTSSGSAAGNILAVNFYLDMRYKQAVLPSVITD